MGMLFCKLNQLRIEEGIRKDTRTLPECVEDDRVQWKSEVLDEEHHSQRYTSIHSRHAMNVDSRSALPQKPHQRLLKARIHILESGLGIIIHREVHIALPKRGLDPLGCSNGFCDVDHVRDPIVPDKSRIQECSWTHHQIGTHNQGGI